MPRYFATTEAKGLPVLENGGFLKQKNKKTKGGGGGIFNHLLFK